MMLQFFVMLQILFEINAVLLLKNLEKNVPWFLQKY